MRRLTDGIRHLRLGLSSFNKAFHNEISILLSRVFRDCAWLSPPVAAIVFLPELLFAPVPVWLDLLILAVLTLTFGIVVIGWTIAVKHSLRNWPSLGLGLAVAVPLTMTILGHLDARMTLAQRFGVSPNAFPVTLEVLTAITTLWLIFATASTLLLLLLAGHLAYELLVGAGASWTFLRSAVLVLPLSAMIAIPLTTSISLVPHFGGLARLLDSQPNFRCNFATLASKPEAVTFISDTQVLAWGPGEAPLRILPCRMAPDP